MTLLGCAIVAAVTSVGQLASPDGRLVAAFGQTHDASGIRLTYDGRSLADIKLGLDVDKSFWQGCAVERVTSGAIDGCWTNIWGECRIVRDRCRTQTVRLCARGGDARRIDVEMRAYDEGFAFRYRLPLEADAAWRVTGERTSVVWPRETVGWPIPHGEATYPAAPIVLGSTNDTCMLPLTVRTPDGCHASLFEAYARHYPRSHGALREDGVTFKLLGEGASGKGPFETPWRVVQVGPSAAKLIEHSTLVLNLNPPCALADTSWIKPGLCLSDLSNCTLDNASILAAAQRERANGIRHFQIDWGWYGTEWPWTDDERAAYRKGRPDADEKFPEWERNTRCTPYRAAVGYVPYRSNCFLNYGTRVDMDVPALARDLHALGMTLSLYLHGQVLESVDLDDLFRHYRMWGVDGLKPGFVRYGDAASTDWNRRLVETAAKHRLWLDVHDRQVPDGLQRTYPNLMLCEGGGGEEGRHPVQQDVVQPFARCLVGPFDYTPRLFKKDRTHAHSVAMLLVYPWPVAVLRGKAVQRGWGPERAFVRALPMTYDETRVISAEVGRHLVVARRAGDVWYVAGMCGTDSCKVDLKLDFLTGRDSWRAEMYVDAGADGTCRQEARTVKRAEVVSVDMLPAGGFAMIIR